VTDHARNGSRSSLLAWMGATLLVGACARSSSPRDPEPTQDVEPDGHGPVVVVEPPPTPEAGRAEIPAKSAGPTGIPQCDEYLALYASCEAYLEPEIMAGNRRFHRVEEASLVYYAGTPEAATLPASCRTMREALEVDCPEQHRKPPAASPPP
jgi:hypothetical protein